MLGEQILHSGIARTAAHVIKRRVPFPQCDRMFFGNLWQQLSKAPDAALVKRFARCSTVEPKVFEGRGIVFPLRKNKLEQIATIRAAKILRSGIRSRAAADAAQTRLSGMSGQRHDRIVIGSKQVLAGPQRNHKFVRLQAHSAIADTSSSCSSNLRAGDRKHRNPPCLRALPLCAACSEELPALRPR